MRVLRVAVAAAITIPLMSACDPMEPVNPRAQVLRIASWNTFNLPTIAGQMGQINMDEEERGKLVGQLLKQSGYDVIALNEVFDETVRDALIDEVESGPDRFTFVVEDIDGGGNEDSGLVLLSRLAPIRFDAPEPEGFQHATFVADGIPPEGTVQPFAGTNEYYDTRNCADMDVWWDGQPDDGEVDSWTSGLGGGCLLAFHRYRHCTKPGSGPLGFGSECEAGKGVGFVRLRQRNGDPLDVYWSHTQATLTKPEYDDPIPDWASARRGQFEELAAMVKHWTPPLARDVAVMGDLNVDGGGAPGSPKDEYHKLIEPGPNSTLGELGLRDLWAEAATAEDAGMTWSYRNDHVAPTFEEDGDTYSVPEERLDYVLWRDRDGGDSCAQHPRVLRHFDKLEPNGTTIDLSDHFGIGVEIRPRLREDTDPCTPSTARRLADLMPTGEMSGKLHVPGACQWLRIEDGTWTVTSLSAQPLRITAVAADDISEPLAFFRGDEVLQGRESQDEIQTTLDRPFLLKICLEDSMATGNFLIRVAPNVGADPAHPVVLTLNRERAVGFGPQFGANPSTLLWMVVQLPGTFSGAGHNLTLDLGDHAPVKLRAGTAEVGGASPAVSWTGEFAETEGLLAGGQHGESAMTELHVVLERPVPANASEAVNVPVRAISDHHNVELGVLECIEQEDATGDDRIRLTYAADGRKVEIVDLGDFDEGQDKNLSGHTTFGSTWVKGDVSITIYDQDGTDLENDVTSGNALDNLGTVTIPAFTGQPPVAAEVSPGAGKFEQDGADYKLEYVRRR